MTEDWDPTCYEVFATERKAPFVDLVSLVEPLPGGRAVDLGCGPGNLTLELHSATAASRTVGVDNSPAMIERAMPLSGDGVSFELGDIATWRGEDLDLIFANASLHWVADHPGLITRLSGCLGPRGQLAFQVPANADHPSHQLPARIAAEPPFRELLAGNPPVDSTTTVLPPQHYAELLDGLGFAQLHVRLQVYGHHLASTEAVVDWVQGTLLVPYRQSLEPPLYEQFVATYRQRLVETVGSHRPYFYAFKRILAWGRRR